MPETSAHLAEVLPTHTPELFRAAVARATALLRAGRVVALPTETVYGLAAHALDPAAVAEIFRLKGRPAGNPVIVHVADRAQARACSAEWPAAADRLADAFWPGPLTVVVWRAPGIPDVVTAGGDTVGLRWPSHPFMQAVIRACGFPLAAPSANLANRVSPTNAAHVAAGLGEHVPLIVDGGQAQVGIESAVVDVTERPPRLLRPGMIHEASLRAVLGELATGDPPGGRLRSPGRLPKHYAPRARVLVRAWRDDAELAALVAAAGFQPGEVHVIAHSQIPATGRFGGVSVIPHDAEAYARALYAEWHRCDAAGVAVIVVEVVPEAPEWQGVADRLARAAG